MRDPRLNLRMLANPLLVGTVVILVTAIAVFISSTAQNGLPFLPTYEVNVQLPDAAHLAPTDDVRIGGDRIGQVKSITAVVPARGHPFSRVTLALSPGTKVPVDTTVQVLPASILGAKYVALTPGRARRRVPDGGTLSLSQSRSVVELTDTFDTFDAPTRAALQNSIIGLGDALAGRGADLNDTIAATSRLLGPLDRVLGVVDVHRADLAGFIQGAAGTSGALAPVADTLVSLMRNGSQTFQALNAAGPSLGQALDQLPGTESVSTHALGDLLPVLTDAATLTRGLRAGSQVLPATAGSLADASATATRVLGQAPRPLGMMSYTLSQLGGAAGPLHGALNELTPAIASLHPVLNALEPAQVQCNVAGLFARNVSSAFSEGDAAGSWYRVLLIGLPPGQFFQEPKPAANLHSDYYPRETARECQSGNEVYRSGQQIGDPGPTANTTQLTYPPAGVTEAAQRAGVIPGGSGGGR